MDKRDNAINSNSKLYECIKSDDVYELKKIIKNDVTEFEKIKKWPLYTIRFLIEIFEMNAFECFDYIVKEGYNQIFNTEFDIKYSFVYEYNDFGKSDYEMCFLTEMLKRSNYRGVVKALELGADPFQLYRDETIYHESLNSDQYRRNKKSYDIRFQRSQNLISLCVYKIFSVFEIDPKTYNKLSAIEKNIKMIYSNEIEKELLNIYDLIKYILKKYENQIDSKIIFEKHIHYNKKREKDSVFNYKIDEISKKLIFVINEFDKNIRVQRKFLQESTEHEDIIIEEQNELDKIKNILKNINNVLILHIEP